MVRVETEAVLALLTAPPERVHLIRTATHALENAYNSLPPRREAVARWLTEAPFQPVPVPEVRARAITLTSLGFPRFDSLHLAAAELSKADVFVTVDYRLLSRSRKHSVALAVRVADPMSVAAEVFLGTADHQPQ